MTSLQERNLKDYASAIQNRYKNKLSLADKLKARREHLTPRINNIQKGQITSSGESSGGQSQNAPHKPKIARKDVYYLLIVNLPTQEEMDESIAQLQQIEEAGPQHVMQQPV